MKITFLLKRWFDELFLVTLNFSFLHTALTQYCRKTWNYLSSNFSWNQFFSNFFSKTLLSRNFCQKSARVNFRNFHTHSVKKWKIYSHRKNISSNQLVSNSFSRTVTFTKFLPKMRESKFPYHSVEITVNLLLRFLGKIFVKATHLLNNLLKSWFDGKKLWWE